MTTPSRLNPPCILFLTIGFLCFGNLYSQEEVISKGLFERLLFSYESGQIDKGVDLINQEFLPILDISKEIKSEIVFDSWYYIVIIYNRDGQYSLVRKYGQKVLNDFNRGGFEFQVDSYKLVQLRRILSSALLILSDIDLGILILEDQLAYLNKNELEDKNQFIGLTYSQLGHAYTLKGDFEDANYYFNKAKPFCDNDGALGQEGCFYNYHRYLAVLYKKTMQYSKAEFIYERILKLYSEGKLSNNYSAKGNIEAILSAAGSSYYHKGDLDMAIPFFKKAFDISISKEGKRDYDRGISLAAALSAAGRFEEARYYLRKGLEDYNFQATQHPFEALSVDDQKVLIGLYFMAKNEQASYDAGLGEEHLYLAAAYREYSVAILERMGEQIVEKSSARYLLDRFYYIFEEAINTRYVLYEQTDSLHHLEAAFQYAARSKTMRIREVQQREALEYTLPKALIERQQGLRSRFVQLENQQYDAGGQNEKLGAAIRKAKEEYYAYIDSLRTAFPQAASLWEAPEPPSLEDVQQGLKARGQGLLQYFIGYQYVFSFIFDGASATLTKAPLPEQLPERVDRFRSSIYQWALDPAAERLEVYTTEANWLYETFIAPLEGQLSQRLIIIPDNVLSYVPFEALLKEKPAAEAPLAAYPYLLKSYQFSYAYSPYLLLPIQRSKRRQKGKVLAYAPLFSPVGEEVEDMAARQRQFGALLANEKEAAAIQGYFPTELRTGEQASAARFLEEASGYQVLHLATHAKANDSKGDFSFLCFSELPGDTSGVQNRIYARDLYDIDLSADLVVLSACETGIGEFSRGEGVISLSNAFAKAGAKSLVTTLWRISDEAAAIIMEAFYANLKDGQPKDLALHNAKLAYWAQSDDQGHHPFFWAAFVPQGDMRPLSLSRPLFPFLLYGILGAIFVLLGVNYMKKRNQAHATH